LDDRILLATAIILLRDEIGNLVPGRVLLDSGSQSNLITEKMVQVLGLKKKRILIIAYRESEIARRQYRRQ